MPQLRTTTAVMDALGGNHAVGRLTGRTANAANNWRHFKSFPSNTYLILTGALKAKGYTAPPSLWRMVGADQ